MPIIAGQITGSVLSGSLSYTFLSNIPSGIVSGAAQVAPLLPAGTVSSSGQVDYNSITNKLSGVVSSSTQVQPLLPGGTVSASNQVDITATTNYSTFSSSLATVDVGQTTRIDNLASLTSSYAINSTIQGQLAGVVSSSTQVQPLLPGGTVSSSGQVSITATTGYSTFSSSIATKNDTQDVSIGALNAATSSYAVNATIQGQLAGVVSSSAQVKPLLPGGTVTSSAQYPGWVTASSQIDYNSITNKLSGVVSSSAQVQPLLPAGTLSSSTQVNAILDADGVFSSSAQVVVQNTTGIGALATTGSNTFTANQTITGSLFISQNLTVLGSSSISYISQSTLNIGTNKITVNTDSPAVRFGGLDVIDSGSSPQRSGSLYFDSLNDQWIFIHQNTAGGITSSVLLVGPATFNNIGSETYPTQNRVLKGAGLEHVTDSQITDNGVTVSITNGLSVGTNLTASQADITTLRATSITSSVSGALTGTFPYSGITGLPTLFSASSQVDYNNITNKLSGVVSSSTQVQPLLPGGTVSASGQVSITATTGYSTFSSSIATKNDTQDVSINALNAATSSYAVNATIQGQLAGVASSSAQVKAYLPGGSVSSSAQYPGWVTASSQIDYNSIQNKLSGVVSSSTQVAPLLPAGTVSSSAQYPGWVTSSGQISITATTGYSTFSSSIATKNDTQDISISALNAATSSYAVNATIQSQLAGVASSSAQVKAFLPGGSVSSSAQYPGWVTASSQVDITATTGYSTFSSSLATVDVGQTTRIDNLASQTSSYAINATIQGQLAGVVSSSTQVKPLLPGGTVTSSAQYPGWVTASSQIDYNSITNKLSGVVSSSTQIVPLLPAGTISASSQVALSGITGTTFATANFTFPQNLTVAGTLTAEQFITEYVSASVIYESGSSKFGDTNDDVMSVTGSIRVLGGNISGSFIGLVSQSAQIDYNSIQNKLSGVVSSSAQVQPLLPGGTVSSSAQYPGWVTSSAQIVWASVNYNAGIVSSSAQVKPLLPDGTVTSSAASSPSQGTVRISINGVNTDVDTGLQVGDSPSLTGLTVTGLNPSQAVFTNGSDALVSNAITGTGNVVMSASPTLTGTITADKMVMSGSQFAGIVSGSGTQYRLVVPVGSNLYAL